MTRASELREMSDEQLDLTHKESAENLFRLRLQAQTERLDAPSELRRQRRTIARVKTIQGERSRMAGSQAVVGSQAASGNQAASGSQAAAGRAKSGTEK